MKVYGPVVDDETRCIHYASPLDVVAIRFKCCGKYYPCYQCHEEAEAHPIERWEKREWDTKAVLCGVCKHEMTIREYMGASACPHCGAPFNPGCAAHYPLYFQIDRDKPACQNFHLDRFSEIWYLKCNQIL